MEGDTSEWNKIEAVLNDWDRERDKMCKEKETTGAARMTANGRKKSQERKRRETETKGYTVRRDIADVERCKIKGKMQEDTE